MPASWIAGLWLSAAAVMAACGIANTWQQEAVYEMHRQCETVGAVHLEDVRPDGSYKVVGDPGSIAQYQRCVESVRASPEWQTRRQQLKRGREAPGTR